MLRKLLGLPAGAYGALKDEILNVGRAGRFASRRLADRVVSDGASQSLAAAAKSGWRPGETNDAAVAHSL